MKKIDLETISDKTKGLPDCWHIDANGKSNPEVLQKHFKLPRSFRADKKNLDGFLARPIRLSRFVVALLHYRNLGTPIMLTGDGDGSPEAHALARFDEGWHLRNEYELIEFHRISEHQQRLMLTDLITQRERKEFKPHQIKLQALANRGNTTVEHAFEVTVQCAAESWLRARNSLANWSKLDDGERSLLAEAVFCGFTFFGKRALEEAAAIEPDVLSHYKSFRGLSSGGIANREEHAEASVETVRPQASEAPESAPGDTHSILAKGHAKGESVDGAIAGNRQRGFPLPLPNDLQHLYKLIAEICLDAQRGAKSKPEPAYQIKDLLDQHLQRLVDLSEQVSTEEVAALVDRFCTALLDTTKLLDFENSDQRDLIAALRSAWKSTVISALETGMPHTWFEMTLSERRNLDEFVDRFDIENAKIVAALAEIDDITVQLIEAKYTARTRLSRGKPRSKTR
jgi:phosphopantetheinyl transferase (holo-ACP synthase)